MGESTTDDVALLGWLADRDVPCPLCGYNLRGQTSPRCPECGRQLRLGVQLAEPFLVAWVTTAAAVCAAAGAGVFLLCIIVAEGRIPRVSAVCQASMIGFVAAIPLAGVVVLGRRRFMRRRRSAQIRTAAVAVAAAIGNTALFALTLR